jgi:hypothetical protein
LITAGSRGREEGGVLRQHGEREKEREREERERVRE